MEKIPTIPGPTNPIADDWDPNSLKVSEIVSTLNIQYKWNYPYILSCDTKN